MSDKLFLKPLVGIAPPILRDLLHCSASRCISNDTGHDAWLRLVIEFCLNRRRMLVRICSG